MALEYSPPCSEDPTNGPKSVHPHYASDHISSIRSSGFQLLHVLDVLWKTIT
jgi:hypothetical protein